MPFKDLKIMFSILALVTTLFGRVEPFGQFWLRSLCVRISLGEIDLNLTQQFWRRCRLQIFLYFSNDGQFVRQSGTVWAIIVERLILKIGQLFRIRSRLKIFLFLALVTIWFSGWELFGQFW